MQNFLNLHKKKINQESRPVRIKQKHSKDSGFGSKAKAKTMEILSKLSKAFLLPIALLPIAGVFLGVGAAITSNVAVDSGGWYFGSVLNKMGDVAFGNLPVLFAISTALAFAKDSGVAAITAVVGFLVMNGIQAALLHGHSVGAPDLAVWFTDGQYHYQGLNVDGYFDLNSNITYSFYHVGGTFDLPSVGDSISLPTGAIHVDQNGMELDDAGNAYYTLLWVSKIPNGLITANIGVTSLNTGVLAGIFVGAIAAWTFNRFHKTQLPAAISFFSGTKLVPIIAFFLVIPLSFIFIIIWPWVGIGLAKFGQVSGKLPVGLDSFIYEIFERSLVPFGLHHVFYAPLWWTNAGGSIAQTFTDAADKWVTNGFLDATFGNSLGSKWDLAKWVEEYAKAFPDVINKITLNPAGKPLDIDWSSATDAVRFNAVRAFVASFPDLWQSMGDQTMSYKVIANNNVINFTMLEHLGLNLGRFQSGKFGFMLFGLPMAALGMWLTVPKQNRKAVMGIYASAAFTCFLTGITEPIEYTFLFLAPWLFYGVHMPLASIAFLLAGLFQTHVSMTVSGGFIDYIVFGIIPFASKAMTWLSVFGVLFVAIIMAPIYFFAFFFMVKHFKVMVPGRDTASVGADTKLFTKADFREKENKANNKAGSSLNPYTNSTNPTEIAKYEKAAKIIEFLGGEANIVDVDSCASRLRLTVVDSNKVNKDGIMSLGGSTGALIRGQSVQVVYGGEQEAIKPRMNEILEIQRRSQTETSVGASTSEATKIVEKIELDKRVMLVGDDMMVDCPNCGQEFKIELVNDHLNAEKSTSVKKPVKKTTTTKKETSSTSAAVKKPTATRKKVVKK